jgi:membrane-associated phospholipid phosphatase
MSRTQWPGAVTLAILLMVPASAAAQATPDQPAAPGVEASLGSPELRGDEIRSAPRLFAGLHRDFQRLFTSDQMVIAALGTTSAMSVYPLDRRIAESGWGRGTATRIFGPGDVVGGGVVQASAALGTYAIGRVFKQPRLARVGSELVRAQLVAQAVTQTIKFTAQRTRPDGSTLSFPSGHTASTFATAAVVQREFGWQAGIPAYALASWVAASRMHSERHYLSDVVMGATIGIMAGRAVTVGSGDARFSVSPIAVDGGIGVSFVKKSP